MGLIIGRRITAAQQRLEEKQVSATCETIRICQDENSREKMRNVRGDSSAGFPSTFTHERSRARNGVPSESACTTGGSVEFLFLLGRLFYGGYFVPSGIRHFRNSFDDGGLRLDGSPRSQTRRDGLRGPRWDWWSLRAHGFRADLGIACIILFLAPVT